MSSTCFSGLQKRLKLESGTSQTTWELGFSGGGFSICNDMKSAWIHHDSKERSTFGIGPEFKG